MYPEMIEAAKAEKHREGQMSFYYANEVEKIHALLYQKLLGSFSTSKENYPYYICPVWAIRSKTSRLSRVPSAERKAGNSER